jgi:hypothetical protein
VEEITSIKIEKRDGILSHLSIPVYERTDKLVTDENEWSITRHAIECCIASFF